MPPVPPGINYFGQWQSPLFDLRPDLRSSTSVTKVGIPIWTRSGRLYVQFFGLEGSVNQNLTMFAQEHANSNVGEGSQGNDPSAVVPPITAPFDISSVLTFASEFAPGSAMLGYAPFSPSLGGGEGYPVRFWYLRLLFFKLIETPDPAPFPDPPAIQIQASFY